MQCSFDNMKVLIFCMFYLKMTRPIHAHFGGFWDMKMGENWHLHFSPSTNAITHDCHCMSGVGLHVDMTAHFCSSDPWTMLRLITAVVDSSADVLVVWFLLDGNEITQFKLVGGRGRQQSLVTMLAERRDSWTRDTFIIKQIGGKVIILLLDFLTNCDNLDVGLSSLCFFSNV